ncbi:hypothetical protein P5673_032814 [Acropora cervicornis]|uniref:Uncharacterized protein n=1 Tax=Acropora cervicornis TaxID=6130 RepID=A0AAD9PQR5_ACRCE|nr:hypothetical protein P5673_032814 [Acropora cervicornis]
MKLGSPKPLIFVNLELFNARLKVSSDKEKENLQSLRYDFVSDEENGVRANKGKWVVRHPIWRLERASALME